ncbi:MAG: MFS transporter, partial [Clostridiales bacterium]|nr:MFS transporter [Clostridiales bacterium]
RSSDLGLIIVSILLTKFSTAGKEPKQKLQKESTKIQLSDFLEVRALLPSTLALIFGISMSGLFTFLVLFGKEINIKNVGVFFLINSLAEFLIRTVAGKLYDRKGHLVVLVPGAIAGFAGTIMLAMSTGIPMLLLSAVVCGAGLGALFPVLEAWTLKSVEPDRRVAANATFYNFLDIGVGLGSIILGAFAQLTDYKTMYLLSSLAYVMFIIVYLACYKKKGREMKKEN